MIKFKQYKVGKYTVKEHLNGHKSWFLNGKLHRKNGPACEYNNGDKSWYLNNKLHREDGPAIEWANGNKVWYLYGKYHREDGPAVEYSNGGKYWYLNGKLHREDGPAIEYANGDKLWYLNGLRHREDGPAIEYANGDKYWFLNDIKYSKENYIEALQKLYKEKEVTEEQFLREIAKNNNWYKTQNIIYNIQKEAGVKENIITSLLIAIILILSGSTIYNVAQKLNLKEEEITSALQNEKLMNKAKEILNQKNQQYQQPKQNQQNQQNQQKINFNGFISEILTHEGLIQGQTPFRYTSPKMREWNTIHGFPIDKTSPIPHNRRNFIFLQNPNDVPNAVKKQFENYSNYPSRYGWNHEPTIKESIEKFDQTGALNKIKFLQNKFPSLNLNQPLKNILP